MKAKVRKKVAAPTVAAFRAVIDGFDALARDIAGQTKLGRGADATAITRAEKKRGRPIPAALKALWSACDGFSFRADVDGAGPIQHAIVSTAETARLGDLEGDMWFDGDDDTDAPDGPLRRFLKVDVPQPEICWGYVLSDAPDADPPLFVFDGDEVSPTKLTLLGYLDKSLAEARKRVAQSKKQAKVVDAARKTGKLPRTKEIVALEKSIKKDTKADGEGCALSFWTGRVLARAEARVMIDLLDKQDGRSALELFPFASMRREAITKHLALEGASAVDLFLPKPMKVPEMESFLGQLEVIRLVSRRADGPAPRYFLNVTAEARTRAAATPGTGLAKVIVAMQDEQSSTRETIFDWPRWLPK